MNVQLALARQIPHLSASGHSRPRPRAPVRGDRTLGIIFEEDKEEWAIHGWGDAPDIIITEAIKAGEKSREETKRVVNVLVGKGHGRFRNLLKTV